MDKMHKDHIQPKAEGGTDDYYNLRTISAKENLRKGARMPNLNEVSDSPNPLKLAVEIDKWTLNHPYNNSRNKKKGFGGLNRY